MKIYVIYRNFKKAIRILFSNGPTALLKKIKNYLLLRKQDKKSISSKMVKAWKGRHGFYIDCRAFGCDYNDLQKQKETVFTVNPKFSIVVPLYNTPVQFLNEMIASVLNQTYGNWELCLADGSDAQHSYVGNICKKIAEKENRIKYFKLEKNGGISENSNAALEMATGDWISLLDHDDLLHPNALFETVRAINEKQADFVYTDEAVFESPDLFKVVSTNFKPDYSPDYFLTNNYICHFSSFRKSLLDNNVRFERSTDGAQDYDLFLQLFELTDRIVHIPKCLYYWRASASSSASGNDAKPYTTAAGKRALERHFSRCGIKAEVSALNVPNTYRISYPILNSPKISILIPNKDHCADLKTCIESILKKTTYRNYEIIIIENNSTQPETFDYYRSLSVDDKIRVVDFTARNVKQPFNYPKINNYGVEFASGEYLVLLNNDTEVISPDWIEQMLMFAQRKDVGVVGAKLYFPDDTIQHVGVVIGLSGVAGHVFSRCAMENYGHMIRLFVQQNYSAVTGACMMIRKETFQKPGSLDESFAVNFNDIDLCMKVRSLGLLVVWTPFAELYHYESKSRGFDDTPEKIVRFKKEIDLFKARWHKEMEEGDPYYNKNLSLNCADYRILEGSIFHS